MNDNTENLDKKESSVQEEKKPNELGGFYFSSHFKIFDPNTEEIIVQQRGDN